MKKSLLIMLIILVLSHQTNAQSNINIIEAVDTFELLANKINPNISSIPKCFCCNTKTYNLPTIPPIEGSETICKGKKNEFKTINCPGATYDWTISPPSILFTGDGTNQIKINTSSIPNGTSVVTIYIVIKCGKIAVKNVLKVKVCKDTLIIREGQDAMLHGLSGLQSSNYGAYSANPISSWTFNGTPSVIYSAIRFVLPPTLLASDVTNATLRLKEFIAPGNGTHATQYGLANKPTNFVIQRLNSNWTESGATFANLSSLSTNTNQVYVASYSSGSASDDININVTQLLKDMITQGNFGFILRWEDDSKNTYYRSRWFGSFNCPITTKRPVLTIH